MVSMTDILSRKRDAPTAMARHSLVYNLYVNGKTFKEIAGMIDRTLGTVHNSYMVFTSGKGRAR